MFVYLFMYCCIVRLFVCLFCFFALFLQVSDQVLAATNNMFVHAVAIARGLQEMGAEVADVSWFRRRVCFVENFQSAFESKYM